MGWVELDQPTCTLIGTAPTDLGIYSLNIFINNDNLPISIDLYVTDLSLSVNNIEITEGVNETPMNIRVESQNSNDIVTVNLFIDPNAGSFSSNGDNLGNSVQRSGSVATISKFTVVVVTESQIFR